MVGLHLVLGAVFAVLSADVLAIVAVFVGCCVDTVDGKVLPLYHQPSLVIDRPDVVVVLVHEVEHSGGIIGIVDTDMFENCDKMCLL